MDQVRECTCRKYNKTTDELVKATAKHRDAVITLREIGEKQKRKLGDYKMKVEQLEYDLDESERRHFKFSSENKELKNENEILRRKLKSRESDRNVNEAALEAENEQLNERIDQLCRKVENNLKEFGSFAGT